jgi:hypothetical protein
MIADSMAALADGASDLRVPADVFADQKEGGLGLARREQIEEAECVGIVGAVVKGERHLSRIAPVSERAAIQL